MEDASEGGIVTQMHSAMQTKSSRGYALRSLHRLDESLLRYDCYCWNITWSILSQNHDKIQVTPWNIIVKNLRFSTWTHRVAIYEI